MDNKHLQVVDTIADLRLKAVAANAVVLVVGKLTVGDGMGAFYLFDADSTEAEDMTFLNVLTSSVSTTGRWKRLNVKTQTLPHGILTMNGGVKTFYASGVTNSSSEFTVNLTMDGTATGMAIFSQILDNSAKAYPTIASTNDAVNSVVKSEAAKITTYLFTRGNNIVLGALGTLGANTFIAAPAGTKVRATIVGI
jgi:hypothetical protein